jgi:hypothetical protein
VDAVAGHEQAIAEGRDGAQEGLGLGGEIAAAAGRIVAVEDDQVHGPGMPIDAGIVSRGEKGGEKGDSVN